MCCPSATLAAWCSAWLAGAAASDDALDALHAWADAHDVLAADVESADALDLSDNTPVPMARLLTNLRRLGAGEFRLVLPVPGDVRGLGGTGEFSAAALNSGEAVLLPDVGYGLVPTFAVDRLQRWTVYRLGAPVSFEYDDLADAEHGLTATVRECASALQDLEIARDRPDVRTELGARIRAQVQPEWPPGTPGRALRVLQRANEIAAIIELAHADDPGAATSASAATKRAAALRPLTNAVRTARRAAVNETARLLALNPGG